MKKEIVFKPSRGQVPTKYCGSCTHCTSDCQCKIHQRQVDKSYNRCFYHSFYQPNAKSFKEIPNLQAIMEEESKIEKKRQAGWIAEHNKMIVEIQKDIEIAKNLRESA